MIFRDDLERDLPIFVEIEEFGQEIEMDGVKLRAQVIKNTAEKSSRHSENFAGLHGDYLTVYFLTAEYCAVRQRLPRQGEWSNVDGKRYDVLSSQNELGIAKVVMSAYRQNGVRL